MTSPFRVEAHWVDLPEGQLKCRLAGTGPVVVILPEPGHRGDPSWCNTPLTQHRTVLVLDPDVRDPWHSEGLTPRGLTDMCELLGLREVDLVIPHGAEALAAHLATRDTITVRSGVRLPGAGPLPSNAAARLTPRADGTHLVAAWHLVRDADLFPGTDGQRGRLGHPPLDRIAARTADLMSASLLGFGSTPWVEALPGSADDCSQWPRLDNSLAPAWPERVWEVVLKALDNFPPEVAGQATTRAVQAAGPTFPPPMLHADQSARGEASQMVRRLYLPARGGQVHVRLEGDPTSPPLLFLHGSPGSAESFAPTLRALAEHHFVVAPDCPGNGASTPCQTSDPELGDLAEILIEALAPTQWHADVTYGIHTGAGLALEMAARAPELTGLVVANGIVDLDALTRADLEENYFADITPQRHGEHLLTAWHMLRDVTMFWPWYENASSSVRGTLPPPAETLDRLVREFLGSATGYATSYRAAFRHDGRAALERVAGLTVAVATETDPLHVGTVTACADLGVPFELLESPAPQHVVAVIRRALDRLRLE